MMRITRGWRHCDRYRLPPSERSLTSDALKPVNRLAYIPWPPFTGAAQVRDDEASLSKPANEGVEAEVVGFPRVFRAATSYAG